MRTWLIFFLQDDNFVSDVYVMYPEETITVEGEFMEVKIPVSPASVEDVTIYRTGTGSSSWTKVDVEVKGSMAHFQTRQGGVYVAVGYKKSGLIAGAVIAALIGVVLIAVASVLYFRKNPESFSSMKRSFASQVWICAWCVLMLVTCLILAAEWGAQSALSFLQNSLNVLILTSSLLSLSSA